VGALRELYELQNVKLRATAIKPLITEKQQRKINEESLVRNERLAAAIRAKRELVFIDEAVFSKRSLIKQTWRKPFQSESFFKSKYSFASVGAVAAINTSG